MQVALQKATEFIRPVLHQHQILTFGHFVMTSPSQADFLLVLRMAVLPTQRTVEATCFALLLFQILQIDLTTNICFRDIMLCIVSGLEPARKVRHYVIRELLFTANSLGCESRHVLHHQHDIFNEK
jgi:hypothetical protein